MILAVTLTEIGLFLLYLSLPILALYLGYLLVTKAFHDMGFSSVEAIIIVFGSFLLGSKILDQFIGIPFANIPLFTLNNWQVGISTGGAIIPILLSAFLSYKNRLPWKRLAIGIIIVAVVTFFVTTPVPNQGVVAVFPFWLAPIVTASIVSIWLMWNTRHQPAPVAYICGTIGVLIGADILHLAQLLQMEISQTTNAVIGGAHVFDMVFITGILAVILDGIVVIQKDKQPKTDNN